MKQFIMTAALAAALAVPMAGNAQHAYPPNSTVVTRAVEGPVTLFEIEGTSTSKEATVFNLPDMQGKKIYAVEVWGYNNADGTSWAPNSLRNLGCYVCPGLPDKNSRSILSYTTVTDGKIYVPYSEGFDVPEGEFTVGWQMDNGTNTPAARFAACVNGVGTENGLWAYHSPTEWANYSADHGPAPIKLYIGDPGLDPSFSMSVSKVENQSIAVGQSIGVTVNFVNDGWCNNSDFVYVVKIDGKQVGDEVKVEKAAWWGGNVQSGVPYPTVIETPVFDKEGTYTVSIEVPLVDDVDNESPNAISTFTVQVGGGNEVKCPESCIPASLVAGAKTNDLGVGSTDVSVATKFSDPMFKGLKVKGVEIRGLRTAGLSDLKLWYRTSLEGENIEEIAADQYGDHAAVLFEKPITIGEDGGPFFGTTFQITGGDNWPIPVGGPTGVTNGCWAKKASGWANFSGYGCLMMTLFVESADIAQNSLKIGNNYGNMIFGSGQEFNAHFYAVNYGKQPVKGITYNLNLDQYQGTGTTDLVEELPVCYGARQEMTIPFAPISYVGDMTGNLAITQVNGAANPFAETLTDIVIKFAAKVGVKRPLFEEFTGTGCGYCPRGMLAMSEMAKQFPDFIAAVYHYYLPSNPDPMYPENVPQPWSFSGAPDANIDRTGSIDPFYGSGSEDMGVITNYLAACDNAAPAALELKADWDKDTKVLTVHSLTNFAFTEAGNKYKLGFIATLSGLKGTGGAWTQSNYYAGDKDYANNPYLSQLIDGSFELNVFHDVVLSNSPVTGVDNSLPAKVEENKDYATVYTFDLSGNELLDQLTDLKNLKVISVLIDNNGRVRNARVVAAGEATMEGEFPEPGDEPQEPTDEVEISYNPTMENWYDTGGGPYEPGDQCAVAICLSDELMEQYKGYTVTGYRAYAFPEGCVSNYADIQMFCLPTYVLGNALKLSTALSEGIVANVTMKFQTIETTLPEPFVLDKNNPVFGYKLGFKETCYSPWPMQLYGEMPGNCAFFEGKGDAFRTDPGGIPYITVLAKAPGATSVEEITVNPNDVIYYDLQGRRINNPQNGIFVKKVGDKVEKVIK